MKVGALFGLCLDVIRMDTRGTSAPLANKKAIKDSDAKAQHRFH
jgi:hypothetical protein